MRDFYFRSHSESRKQMQCLIICREIYNLAFVVFQLKDVTVGFGRS